MSLFVKKAWLDHSAPETVGAWGCRWMPAGPLWSLGAWHHVLCFFFFFFSRFQDSEELSCLVRPENTLALELRWKTKAVPRSPFLVVHFHGGGFVAQTSKSHEPYLKSWAQELGAPILSIDYSLAPEAPFPRALEECFYAYCWALKNCRLLGEKQPWREGGGAWAGPPVMGGATC